MLYSLFERRFLIRRFSQLTTPTINDYADLTLPRNGVIHYLPESPSSKGIPLDHWAIKNSERLVMVDHVTRLSKTPFLGNPKPIARNSDIEIKTFHRTYRKLKLMKDFNRDLRNELTPFVVNYGLLREGYRYTQGFMMHYYRECNSNGTLYSTINHYAALSERHHFYECLLPTPLPALSTLKKAEKKMSMELLDHFPSIDHLQLLDLWQWLGKSREEGFLSIIEERHLPKVNVIIRHGHQWVGFNLGLLNQWRLDIEGDGEIKPDALQLRFLKVLMTLFESSTPVTLIEEEEDPREDDLEEDDLEEIINSEPEEDKPHTVKTKVINEKSPLKEEDTFKKEPEELSIKELIKNDSLIKEETIEEELEAINEASQGVKEEEKIDPFEGESNKELDLIKGVMNKANHLAEEGLLSGAEYKRFQAIGEKFKSIPDPYGEEQSLFESSRIKREEVIITSPKQYKDNIAIVDKSMLESTIDDFDKDYVKKILRKDIIGCVLNFNKAGVAVTDYKVERREDIANDYELHTVRLTPVLGKPSTFKFKIPTIDEEGTYLANNIRYRMRKQRTDVPIRKVKPAKVALTSFYGKVFVSRSERVVNSYSQWLYKTLRRIALDTKDDRITDIKTTINHLDGYTLPRVYSIIGSKIDQFKSQGIHFYFNYEKRDSFFNTDLKALEKGKVIVVGKEKGSFIVMDREDTLYRVKGSELEPLGRIEDVIGIDYGKAPADVAELELYSKHLPLGVVIAYYIGLEKLLKKCHKAVKRISNREKIKPTDQQFKISFEDESLIVDKAYKLESLILAGFNNYAKSIAKYSIYECDKKDIYYNLFDENGLGVRQLKELELLKNLFIDPVTLELLEEMKEPTTWLGLLYRSAELLLTDYSPDEMDMAYMRIRGYERIAGAVYTEMVRAMKNYSAREGSANASVEINPFDVWKTITSDQFLVESSNPIRNVNEKEMTTFLGIKGRGRTSMVARTRIFGKNDRGLISEGSVDSGDIGINAYTTPNPQITSLRGLTYRYDKKKSKPSNLVSTAMLMSPSADMDDGKRVNFITVQHQQTIHAEGYDATPLRTGYERVLPHRVGSHFAKTAEQEGIVKSVTKEALTVEYKDGTINIFEIGRRHDGVAAGVIYPHDLMTSFKKGDTFKEGECLLYNKNFFKPDPLNPKEVLWKAGVMCRVALMEANDTFEDSSVISERVAKKLSTTSTKIRYLFVNFDQTVKNLVSVGDKVDPETILCTIEDSVTADNDLFTEDTLETLKLLSGNAPKAQYPGTVEKIEVLYYGDIEDMSPTLQAITQRSDEAIIEKRKALGKSPVTGKVDDSIRIDKNVLELDSLAIKIYISKLGGTGIGDKGVIGNQLKTIFARVMSGINRTESGADLDVIYSYTCVNARIILSPEVAGTTNTLLRVLSKRVAKVYKGESV